MKQAKVLLHVKLQPQRTKTQVDFVPCIKSAFINIPQCIGCISLTLSDVAPGRYAPACGGVFKTWMLDFLSGGSE